MSKEIAKEVTRLMIGGFIAIIFVLLAVAVIFGIFYLGKIHWGFYGLIPFYMWIVLYSVLKFGEDDVLGELGVQND